MADQIFAVNSGFYDAVNSDRTYSADDMNRPYKRIISNGVFATPKGTKSTDLQVVSANNGMQIIVQKGEGIFADKWFENPAAINITVPANTGTVPRIDSVLVQVDKRTSGRVGNIVYRTGTPSLNPVAPAINTVSNVAEYRLANIRVNAGVTAITSSMITDRRGSSDCPWITSLIYQVDTSVLYDQWSKAYEDYFEAEKEMWDDWYGHLTEELDVSMTLIKHTSTFVTTQETSEITIGISDFNANTDMLEVYINGMRAIEGSQYTINDNASILLSAPLSVGQTVNFVCLKSVIMGNPDDITHVIEALEERIASITGGVPTVVDSASDMTDTDKIYILTTDSKWYYYNLTSSAWVAGGVYGGVPTDRTLTQAGMPADAEAVGERLANLDFDGVPEVATPEEGDADLYICDKNGYVLAEFEDGHIKTKKFDSKDISSPEAFDTFTAKGTFTVRDSLTLTITHDFKKCDEIYFHIEDGYACYDYGAYATYYEGNRIVMNNRRGSNGYVRHIITQDSSSVKVTIGGSAYSSSREITLYVYKKNYDPAPKIVTVKTDGTGMFQTLKAAVDSITDANHLTNPYVIEVYEGAYDALDGYTTEEINSADIGGGYTQTSMVGLKLTDGMSLRGVGRCDDIIITAELDNTFSSAVRGNISTLNLQGEGNLENLTIIGKNIRYCVHDDFRSPFNSHEKRVLKNLKFSGEYLSYYPLFTTYGAGMSSPRDYLIENCDFGYDLGIHSNGGYTYGCTIEVNNCSGTRFRIGDSATADSDAVNRVIVNNCNFQMLKINHGTSGLSNHMMVEGTGNEYSMVSDSTLSMYRLGMIDLAPAGFSTGKMVKRTATGLAFEVTTNKALAHGIVIGSDTDYSYIQKCGYIASGLLNLSGLSIGDYITVDSSGSVVTGGTMSDAIGIVTAVDSDIAYIKMLIGGAI